MEGFLLKVGDNSSNAQGDHDTPATLLIETAETN